jgi:hypothetical protein
MAIRFDKHSRDFTSGVDDLFRDTPSNMDSADTTPDPDLDSALNGDENALRNYLDEDYVADESSPSMSDISKHLIGFDDDEEESDF